ncbi:amino acid permease/ SLC12A domain-containing protein, partial [Sparassis latifolia]
RGSWLWSWFFNCFPPNVHGEEEFWLSLAKVLVIVTLSELPPFCMSSMSLSIIGFKNWKTRFASSYLAVTGPAGYFLGFWSVLMQAIFSFAGSEMPGIPAGEVISTHLNVPRALGRVWISILLFIGGISSVGLLVPLSDPNLQPNHGTGYSSPFIIALELAGVKVALPHIVNAACLLSAGSAACSDIYLSSRLLFFLARTARMRDE